MTGGGKFNYGEGIGRYLSSGGSRQGFACSQACVTNGPSFQAQTNYGNTLLKQQGSKDALRIQFGTKFFF